MRLGDEIGMGQNFNAKVYRRFLIPRLATVFIETESLSTSGWCTTPTVGITF
jgi:hypothetical protein